MDEQFKVDMSRVKSYMYQYHVGWEKSAPRRDIAKALEMEDRYFRQVCADIPEIITSSHLGYYILPLVDITGEETKVAKSIVEGEERRRLIANYLRQRRQREAIRRMGQKEYQLDFA